MSSSPALSLVSLLSRLLNALRLAHLPAHRRRVRRSRKLLRQLRVIHDTGGAAVCFGFLRKVDPLVVEELVLSALERGGRVVLRNRRYTGDGGIDGWVWLRRGWCPVQVKRYESHVNLAHVKEFASLVARRRLPGGLLVHCGRTGKAVYPQLGAGLILVSGDRLIELLLSGKLADRPTAG